MLPFNFVSSDIYILICLSMDIGEKSFLRSTLLFFNFYNIVCGLIYQSDELKIFTFDQRTARLI